MSVEAPAATIPIFGMEADHPTNSDLVIQAVPGCRLRSRIDPNRPHIDHRTGDAAVPRDRAIGMAGLPVIPGMQITVDTAKCTVEVTDPLHGNDQLCEKINRWLNNTTGSSTHKVRGVPPHVQTLDEHRIKTLVREIYNIVESGEGRINRGIMPDQADIDTLPGRYLLNPGSQVQNTQPRFEDEWDTWVGVMSRAGG